MSFWKLAKDKVVLDRLIDERMHALAIQEIEAGFRRDGLWAMAVLQSRGDERETKLAYLKLLVRQLKDEHYVAERHAEESAAAQRRSSESPKSNPAAPPASPSPPAQPAARPRASSDPKRERLISLCRRLRTDDLALDQYELLCVAAGARIGRENGSGGKYVIELDGTKATFNNLHSVRPWFLENVVPRVLATA